MKTEKKYSVTEYAAKIKRSRQRVLQMIESNTLPEGAKVEKVGFNYIIYCN